MAARVRCVGWASDGPRSHKAQLKKHKTPSYGGLLSGDTTRKSACLQRSRCWGRLRGPPKNRRIDAPRPRWWAASATLGVRDTRPVRAWTACPPACGEHRARSSFPPRFVFPASPFTAHSTQLAACCPSGCVGQQALRAAPARGLGAASPADGELFESANKTSTAGARAVYCSIIANSYSTLYKKNHCFKICHFNSLLESSIDSVQTDLLRSVKCNAGDWRVLVVDDVTVQVFSQACKLSDVTDENVSRASCLFGSRSR